MDEPQIRLIVIRSNAIEQSVEFYSSLGIKFTKEQHGSGPEHFAAVLGETVFEIYPSKNSTLTDSTTRLGFAVLSLTAAIRLLRTRKVEIIEEPKETPWGLRAVVRDCDGRSIELYERKPE